MTSALRSVGALLSMGTTERMFPKRQMYACRRDQAGPSPALGRASAGRRVCQVAVRVGSSMSTSDVIENPATGERITFAVSTPELLVMHAVWPRPGHRTVEHAHPVMEERFTATSGIVALRIEDRELLLNAGESAIAPAGARHIAWNPTSGTVKACLEMRPARRWEQFTRRLFAGEDPRGLLQEYADEVVIPPVGLNGLAGGIRSA
jgi:quercetin dioxygenase-like cupin family protein